MTVEIHTEIEKGDNMMYNESVKHDSCMVNSMLMTKQYSVAIYIRLSREDGDKEESNSVTVQRAMLRDYVQSHDDLTLYDVYIDDGYTGTNFNRPEFKRMIADIESKSVNCVLIKDLSRLGRDYLETGFYIEKFFPQNKVRFIAVNDHIDNAGDKEYDMLLPIRNIMNEQYARDISTKVQSAFKTKQKSGEFVGAFCSYGYMKSPVDRHKLIIDEEAASVVREIFDLFVSGYPKLRIAKILNDRDILCPTMYKKTKGQNYVNGNKLYKTTYWTYATINNVLNNEMYLGNMVQGKTKRRMKEKPTAVSEDSWIVVENTHEPIISKEIWDKAKKIQKIRTRQIDFNKNIGLFCGFIFCGDCGRALHRRVDRGKYVYYRCHSYLTMGRKYCTSHNISENLLADIVKTDINNMIQMVSDLQSMILSQNTSINNKTEYYSKEIDRIEKELEKVRYLKKSIYGDYKEGLLTKEEYLAYREEYTIKETQLEQNLQELEDKKNTFENDDILKSDCVNKLLTMKQIDVLNREMLFEVLDKITVYEDKRIKITYTFSNELNALQEITEKVKKQCKN